jgi:gliding motility-associated-like protein
MLRKAVGLSVATPRFACGVFTAIPNANSLVHQLISGLYLISISLVIKASQLKRILLIGLLFVFSVGSTYAQKWLWGREALSKSQIAWGDPEGEHCTSADKNGNLYITAFFFDTLAFGSVTLQDSGYISGGTYHDYTAMLVKYDSNGNAIWGREGKPLGKLSWAEGNSVAVDNAGNVYMAGQFTDTVSFGAFTLRESGTQSVFVVKYNSAGTVQWATQAAIASTASSGLANSIAVDAAGNTYITGTFNDTISFGAFTLRNASTASDVFLVKLNPSGNPVWAKQGIVSGSFCFATGYSVTVDAAGNPYMAGSFNGALTMGTVNLNSQVGDEFIVKYDVNGNSLWGHQSLSANNGSSAAGASSVCADGAGGIYVTGSFYGNVSFGSINITTSGKPIQPFLAKYATNGGLLWVKQGTATDNNGWYSFSVACDTFSLGGGYMVTSVVTSGNSPYSMVFDGDTFQLNTPFQSATVLLKFDSAGNTLCGSIFSEGDEDDGDGVCVDHSGRYIYIGGDLDSTTIFGPDTLANAGPIRNEHPYVARWKACCGFKSAAIGAGTICQGDSIKLSATGGGTYLWNTGATSSAIEITPDSTLNYTVSVSLGSCTQSDTVKVNVNPVPMSFLKPLEKICAGGSVTLFASGATSYAWSPSTDLSCNTCPSPIAKSGTTTEYTLTLSDGPCSVKDSTLVIVNPVPVITACCDSTIIFGQSVQLNSSGGSTYLWSPSQRLNCNTCTDPVASPTMNTTYTLTVTSDSGCTAQQLITIDVSCGTVFVPEAFSPNGDGQNDVLYVRGDCINTLDFKMFDRWGNKVFETNDKNIGWDGRCRGEAMNSGSYVYYVTGTLYDGTTQTKKGNVVLVR